MLLALDTCTSIASLALFEGEVLAECTWRAGREHSAQLLLEVDRALARLGRRPADLTAVAVAHGPGSFTGVRVGIALAKGLAFALDLPAYGVCSLDVLAATQELAQQPVRPLLEAGRGRFATALYQRGSSGWERQGPIQGIDLDALPGLVQVPTVVCGDLWGGVREQVAQRLGPLAILASPAASPRRAGYLAQLAWQRWQAGERPTPQALEAVYLAR
ncbi:MAG: tRNA (adenosine(37)-N6)-threonylcarbamoyltransferase complex dimerization subunit type 1 TsaB [Chloroflexi bacterium]|nr:tRNA (adenosine(37)-N6)-threonylcarbamoyltransferase complex dimerization subunit type 1 TsaB [Chloroflexota bacterium]